MAASSFSESRSERSRKAFLRLLPPKRHITALATGGLNRLYARLRESKDIVHNELSRFTDDSGRFQPPEGLLLASRYQVVDVLPCRGQSAMLIRAQDVVQDNVMVMIKALHSSELYFEIGFQEAYVLRRLACADPHRFSHTVRLLNTFLYDHHFCLVFELLDPRPITHVLASLQLSHTETLRALRKVALQLLQVLGFLQQNNTIHADLKPENILLHDVQDISSLRVIDFGNAINHVHREMSLYYQDFQVQTLLYRAPEVVFGIPFGAEIDMWSLGCILAQIYLGQPLIFGTDRRALVESMVDILGPLPRRMFQRGKYFDQLEHFTTKDVGQSDVTSRLMTRFQHRSQPDFCFTNLLAGMLSYDPGRRLTPAQAAQHPFLAPEVCLSYLLPDTGCQRDLVSATFLSAEDYKYHPEIAVEVCRQGPSSTDLLRMGTGRQLTDSPRHVPNFDVPEHRVLEHENTSPLTSHGFTVLCQRKSSGRCMGIDQDCFSQVHHEVSTTGPAQNSDASSAKNKTDENSPRALWESQVVCTHVHHHGRQDYLPLTSQTKASPETMCPSPDTTCVMELSQGVTRSPRAASFPDGGGCSKGDCSRELLHTFLDNTSSQAGCKRRHHLKVCSKNNTPAAFAAQISTSGKMSARHEKVCLCSQNESSGETGNSRWHSSQKTAVDMSARRLLNGSEPCGSTCSQYFSVSEERRWKHSHSFENTRSPVGSDPLNKTFTIQDSRREENISGDTSVPLEKPNSPVQADALGRSRPKHTELSLPHAQVRTADGKPSTSSSPTLSCLSRLPDVKHSYSKLNTSPSPVDRVRWQSTGPCADMTFETDSDDSGHEKLRSFIHAVSQGTPLAQLHPDTGQATKQHRVQLEAPVCLLQNFAARSTDSGLKGSEFVHPSCRSWRKLTRSTRKVKSEGLALTGHPEPRARENSKRKVGGIRQKSSIIIHSLVRELSQDRAGHCYKEAVVPLRRLLDVSSSTLQAQRPSAQTSASPRAPANKEKQLVVQETTTTRQGMSPVHQDGMTVGRIPSRYQDPATRHTATSPYVGRSVRRKKSGHGQDSASDEPVAEKLQRRKSVRNRWAEGYCEPPHTQAARRFLPCSRASDETSVQERSQQSVRDEQDRVSPCPGTVCVVSSNKITKHSHSQAHQEAVECGAIKVHCVSQHGRKKAFKQSRRSICRNGVATSDKAASGGGECKLWMTESKPTDWPTIPDSTSPQTSGDLAFRNSCCSGAHRMREWVLSDSPPLGSSASHGGRSVAEKTSYVGALSPAAAVPGALTESPPIQRVVNEGPDLRLQDEADHKMGDASRDKDGPGQTCETSDDGDDDVIMLIQ